MAEQSLYPVSLTVDYPDRELNRVTTFFRLFMAIPIVIVITLLAGGGGWGDQTDSSGFRASATGILFVPTVLMLVFQQKYPRWWFDWNAALLGFSFRVAAYLLLLRDEYPSTDEEQAVHLRLAYPDAKQDLNRWLPLVKWFLAIPHFIVLIFLGFALFVSVVVAWFAILFTGRYPR